MLLHKDNIDPQPLYRIPHPSAWGAVRVGKPILFRESQRNIHPPLTVLFGMLCDSSSDETQIDWFRRYDHNPVSFHENSPKSLSTFNEPLTISTTSMDRC